MRYVVTLGEHTKHVFRNGTIILPKKLMRFEVHDAVILYAFSKRADKEKEDFIIKNVKEAKERFEEKNIPCLVKEVKEPYNFSRNVYEFRKLIKPKTVINLTGGRRIIGLELFYAAIFEKDKLLSVFYVSDEGEVIELPLVEPGGKLSSLETEILEVLKEKPLSISELAYKLQRRVPLISQYIARLEAKGYIKREKIGKRVFVERIL
ncbi:MAG: CRISPR-associated CARF protein Csa3 [Archaeoglobaceae archaeon]|nr:CRISPR-associated CARF protein Csa3 [Archaeoglobaceae archaeon]